MLTVLLGDYGSGKTGLAKQLARESGGVYLDIDVVGLHNGHYSSLAQRLKDVINFGVDYYLDGWSDNRYYENLSLILGMPVKYIVCMACPARIQKEQEARVDKVASHLPRPAEKILDITLYLASIALSYDPDPLFADTTDYPATFWRKDQWLERWHEIKLYSDIKNSSEYQDVELPGRSITGLSQSFKTWERLNTLVNFKGKAVCDLGCNLGYFSFKVEEAGASSVIGIDAHLPAIFTAGRIAAVKKSNVQFRLGDLKKMELPDSDVIMALNTLHHVNNDKTVLGNIFSHAGTVVIEAPVKDKPHFDSIARQQQFNGPAVASSHRDNRCILVYSKGRPTVQVPPKYIYRPYYESLKRFWKRGVFETIILGTLGQCLKIMYRVIGR